MEATSCRRCGRPIRAAGSIATGYGHACMIAEIAARLEGFPEWQVKKACEAFDMGAVIPTTRPGRYAVVSSDGSRTYIADARWKICTCKAAECRRQCYHVAAAIIASVAAPVSLAA